MVRLVFCLKLNKEAEGLEQPPFPNAMGEKIFQHISKEAWKMWISHQTMLINEYRLSVMEPQARSFLFDQMQAFLFGNNSETV